MCEEHDVLEIFCRNMTNVLEHMAFIFAEQDQNLLCRKIPERALQANMSFKGMNNGSVSLAVPVELCREFAVNMLGTESEELSENIICDALREVLNMSCGQFLTERYGLKPVFDLTVPEVVYLDAAGWEAASVSAGVSHLIAEDQPLLAAVEIE